ncbi:hypothetical protein AA309_12570 [Microvirga vignae]|uniref:RNA polymerase sigma factor 70 region 4 type 2 domain-containing protein n=1 Tax=Microvirga vignae TaxID=1225564 RepID=A0A0H1RCG7_9HYPH|nr:sigma factor-like helix-turn-helix DNA-binding protein [Microvirga vignae]KLK92546.1 hypothetical protein AA309_12570 [Microvirga vignae]
MRAFAHLGEFRGDSPIFRTVFIMREVEEMSVEETAAQLGINAATVRTRLHRARRLLRKALDERLVSAMKDAFPFDGLRCARIMDRVMQRVLELQRVREPHPAW